MKSLISNVLAALSLVSFSTIADVNLAEGYQTPEEVVEYGSKYEKIIKTLSTNSYELNNCQITAINYFRQPEETVYRSHIAQCTYVVPKQGIHFINDYADVSIDIYYNQTHLLHHEGDVTVRYFTVY
ncbi:hypothetical protein [Pseudoalteromonas denitrificans]|uniref:Uncharacterized protein n=1 Tax=Pseudoalteromonas denitrificans DSM 6059 TaxID=1123010 RepID=A0A1I1S9E0_9GAMM|nr:hypothetical protein [Pseudoalteromonas denitrificans]SFD41228.1 hypothetical protein SAMN02745724_04448 [Pseudoalteromonas denitrificans DSM 6059]